MKSKIRRALAGALVGAGFLFVAGNAAASIIQVDSYGDDTTNNGNCTLREAIIAVNTQANRDACNAGNGANDTIRLPTGQPVELQASLGSPTITKNVTITGDGYLESYIDSAGQAISIMVGDSTHAPTVTFQRLVIQDSTARCIGVFSGTASLNYVKVLGCGNPTCSGSGVTVWPGQTLNVSHSFFVGNTGYQGGAIHNEGFASVSFSTILNSDGEHGGAILSNTALSINNSTIAKNKANAEGGAIFLVGGTASILSSTIAFNTSNTVNSSACTSGCGALQAIPGLAFSVKGSVVAHNDVTTGPTQFASCKGTVTSTGYNLLGESVNTACPNRLSTDLPPQSAKLLGQTIGSGVGSTNWPTNIGGIADAYLTDPTSPLIGAIPSGNAICTSYTDERGVARNKGNTTCDIGAIERSNALYVENTGGPQTDQDYDMFLRQELTGLGFTLSVVDDSTTTAADANGKHLVFISQSVDSATVNTKFLNVTNTVVVDEPFLYPYMKMTGTVANTDYGVATGITAMALLPSTFANYMGVLGYSPSSPYGFDSPSSVAFGVPAAAAIKGVMLDGISPKATYFIYQKGSSMVGMTAPGPRVGFYMEPQESLADDGNLEKNTLIYAASF